MLAGTHHGSYIWCLNQGCYLTCGFESQLVAVGLEPSYCTVGDGPAAALGLKANALLPLPLPLLWALGWPWRDDEDTSPGVNVYDKDPMLPSVACGL